MYLPETPVPLASGPTPVVLTPADRDGLIARLTSRGVIGWIGAGITLSVLAAVFWELRQLHWQEIVDAIPHKPIFWMLFAGSYLATPFADWVIFRRLWKIPFPGFVALLRKNIGNNLLLGYVGELYFYTWARTRADMPGSPFGAVKDVAILSALTGNVATLLMVAIAYPLLGNLNLAISPRTFAISIAVVLLSSSAIMFFRRRLFSLSRPELRYVAVVHFLRIIAATAMSALMWHFGLPGQDVGLWLLLATMQLLITRLPLLPNKDLVFAGVAVFLMGHDVQVGALMTLIASLMLVTHAVLGAVLVSAEIADWGRK